MGYKGLQWFTGGYGELKGGYSLQAVKRDYKRLLGVTRGYKRLQGVTRG